MLDGVCFCEDCHYFRHPDPPVCTYGRYCQARFARSDLKPVPGCQKWRVPDEVLALRRFDVGA